MANIKWALDPTHSEVTFKIRHLMISTVTGRIKSFTLNAETTTDDFNTAKNIEFVGDIDSIDTNNEQRDGHLKSADFFKKEEFPHVKFVGKKYESAGEVGTLPGDLTIAGFTKPVSLNIEFGGIVVDTY
jgi:polyisoprenoid-binding protein YceI